MSGKFPSVLSAEARRAKGDKPSEPPCSFRNAGNVLREGKAWGLSW